MDADNISHRILDDSDLSTAMEQYYQSLSQGDEDTLRMKEFLENNSFEDVEKEIFKRIKVKDTNGDRKKTMEDLKENDVYEDTYMLLKKLKEIKGEDIALGNYHQMHNVPEMRWVTYDDLLGEFEFFGFLYIPYKEEYLKDDVSVSLIYPDEENRIEIWASVYLEEEAQLNLHFRYEYAEHKLTYVPIVIVVSEGEKSTFYKESEEIHALLELYNLTKEEIREYQGYVLYDVVVGTWVNANGGNLEKEEEKVGRCTLVDNTFNFDDQQ